MPRINVKGGVWRNTEDEILKAAVMKYGKNQWARIASLLHRKAAKQCKARWYEWLDPSVKKTEWARDEDEKLLHLAKLMPTQWRTIAPIVGRTAAQCLERYEQLLDRAQNRDIGEDDARKLRPGEIDPNPETKPARPDAQDMDEDELEMLSEARARLANTQGKKAKRKARERMLEMSRRIALTQKRREMNAAGVRCRMGFVSKRKFPLNYNEEIPFEKMPRPGFYDTSEEANSWQKNQEFKPMRLSNMEYESRETKERKMRRDDREKQERRKEANLPEIIKNQSTFSESNKKRSKLVLPAPQISDAELENLVKVGQAQESALRQALMEAGGTEEMIESVTSSLLGNYKDNQSANAMTKAIIASARTPHSSVDSLMQEARNLVALQNAQTPLKGGDNAPLEDSDFTGVTPRNQVVATPNTMLVHAITGGQTPINATPGQPGAFGTPALHGGFTPGMVAGKPASDFGATPLRDHMQINPTPQSGSLELMPHLSLNDRKRALREGLSSLPQPKNNFEIVVPSEDDIHSSVTEVDDMRDMVVDQSDIDRERARKISEEKAASWAKRSQALQRDLPRPAIVNREILKTPEQIPNTGDWQQELALADELIKEEMLLMLHYDNLHNPPATLRKPQEASVEVPVAGGGSEKSSGPAATAFQTLSKPASVRRYQSIQQTNQSVLNKKSYDDFEEEELEMARKLILEESLVVKAAMGHGELSADVFGQVWEECYSQVLYLPGQRRFTRANMASKRDRIESCERQLERKRQQMEAESKKASKLEKKLKVLHGGYISRAETLVLAIKETYNQLEQSHIQHNAFEKLRAQELEAIARRTQALEEDVRRQQIREDELQQKFAILMKEKEELEEKAMKASA